MSSLSLPLLSNEESTQDPLDLELDERHDVRKSAVEDHRGKRCAHVFFALSISVLLTLAAIRHVNESQKVREMAFLHGKRPMEEMGVLMGVTAVDLDQYQIQEILYWHNLARSELAAQNMCGNMLQMTWSNQVAKAAQSNRCPLNHNGKATQFYGEHLGENLAWSTDTCSSALCARTSSGDCAWGSPSCESLDKCKYPRNFCTFKAEIYEGWYQSETTNPSSTADGCVPFSRGGGHCTQVTWQNSETVGCTYQHGCGKWATTLACNYAPSGNVNINVNVPSYGDCISGAPCSHCPPSHPYCTGPPTPGLCSKVDPSKRTAAQMKLLPV
eukprot:g56519.t1